MSHSSKDSKKRTSESKDDEGCQSKIQRLDEITQQHKENNEVIKRQKREIQIQEEASSRIGGAIQRPSTSSAGEIKSTLKDASTQIGLFDHLQPDQIALIYQFAEYLSRNPVQHDHSADAEPQPGTSQMSFTTSEVPRNNTSDTGLVIQRLDEILSLLRPHFPSTSAHQETTEPGHAIRRPEDSEAPIPETSSLGANPVESP